MSVKLEHGSATHIGRVRENNEDYLLASRLKRVYWVADGLGGLEHGEVASQKGVKEAHKAFKPADPNSLSDSLSAARRMIIAIGEVKRTRVGTTLTGLHIDKAGGAHIAHVGDCRVYHLSGEKLRQLTTDHNEAARGWPTILTEYIGGGGLASFRPQLLSLKTSNNDVFLLCSDGVHGQVDDNQIREVLEEVARQKLKPQAAAQMLIKLANAAGGRDNATAIVIQVLHKK